MTEKRIMIMPYVDIKLAGKISIEQREEISKEVSAVIARVANKSIESIYISFTEFDRSEFAKGGEILSNLDKRTHTKK